MAEKLNLSQDPLMAMLHQRPQLQVRVTKGASAGGSSNADVPGVSQPAQQVKELQQELADQKRIVQNLQQQKQQQQQVIQQLQQLNQQQQQLNHQLQQLNQKQLHLINKLQTQLAHEKGLNQQHQQQNLQQLHQLNRTSEQEHSLAHSQEHSREETGGTLRHEETQVQSNVYKHRRELSHMRYMQLVVHDIKEFKSYIKMSPAVFQLLCNLCCPFLKARKSYGHDITTAEQLSATLRYIITGLTIPELATLTYIPIVTLREVVSDCCKAIDLALSPAFMRLPSTLEEWAVVAKGFEQKWGFPFCIGAIDGMHVRIQAKKAEQEDFKNYKNFPSVVWLALVNADCEILYSDIGAPGRMGDGRTFSTSDLQTILGNIPSFNLPTPEGITDYVVVGDNAFPLSKKLLIPFVKTELESIPERLMFNARLSRARQVVERTFGMLTRRFHIIRKNVHLSADKMAPILRTCGILHNFIYASEQCGNNIQLISQRVEQANDIAALVQQQNTAIDVPTEYEVRQRGNRAREIFVRLMSSDSV